MLTSIPFGSGPGQPVSHTITLSSSGTGTVAAVRVTFTTTVDLGGVTAKSNTGRCTASARTVFCDLGNLRFPATPTITITGTVDLRVTPGTLVQNRVSVDSSQFTNKSANHVASNAYLVSGAAADGQASAAASHPTGAAASAQVTRRSANRMPIVATVLAVAVAALAGAVLLWRRRQSRLSPAEPGKAET